MSERSCTVGWWCFGKSNTFPLTRLTHTSTGTHSELQPRVSRLLFHSSSRSEPGQPEPVQLHTHTDTHTHTHTVYILSVVCHIDLGHRAFRSFYTGLDNNIKYFRGFPSVKWGFVALLWELKTLFPSQSSAWCTGPVGLKCPFPPSPEYVGRASSALVTLRKQLQQFDDTRAANSHKTFKVQVHPRWRAADFTHVSKRRAAAASSLLPGKQNTCRQLDEVDFFICTCVFFYLHVFPLIRPPYTTVNTQVHIWVHNIWLGSRRGSWLMGCELKFVVFNSVITSHCSRRMQRKHIDIKLLIMNFISHEWLALFSCSASELQLCWLEENLEELTLSSAPSSLLLCSESFRIK